MAKKNYDFAGALAVTIVALVAGSLLVLPIILLGFKTMAVMWGFMNQISSIGGGGVPIWAIFVLGGLILMFLKRRR